MRVTLAATTTCPWRATVTCQYAWNAIVAKPRGIDSDVSRDAIGLVEKIVKLCPHLQADTLPDGDDGGKCDFTSRRQVPHIVQREQGTVGLALFGAQLIQTPPPFARTGWGSPQAVFLVLTASGFCAEGGFTATGGGGRE